MEEEEEASRSGDAAAQAAAAAAPPAVQAAADPGVTPTVEASVAACLFWTLVHVKKVLSAHCCTIEG
jgi:hypothetical protein